MFGFGVLRGMMVTLKHFIETYTEDPRRTAANAKTPDAVWQSPNDAKGLFTVEYPEQKLRIFERFRFYPMLIVDGETGVDWCTSCGICAKVCPPQCIWIVRGTKPDGKPKPEPEEFYIDTTICMQCGYCAEFCPFDAIKMNHDYELSAYERHESAIYNKDMLSVTTTYYARTHPIAWAEEKAARDAKDAKKAGAATPVVETQPAATEAGAPALLPSGRPKPISARAAKAARLAAGAPAEGGQLAPAPARGPDWIDEASATPMAQPRSPIDDRVAETALTAEERQAAAHTAQVERQAAEQRGASTENMGVHGAGDPLIIPNNRETVAGREAADEAAEETLRSPDAPTGPPSSG
jgi:NADH-quinone oxidoreductase subunit I